MSKHKGMVDSTLLRTNLVMILFFFFLWLLLFLLVSFSKHTLFVQYVTVVSYHKHQGKKIIFHYLAVELK